jgi:cytochrome c-type biogenesis protein CcmH
MVMFWVIAGVLIVGALALILPALLWQNGKVKTDANAEKREIFRQQFDEIEQDKINGVLDGTQYEIAKSEMQRRMLDEIGQASLTKIHAIKSDRKLALILLILLPLSASLIYLKIGNPAAINPQNNIEQIALDGDMQSLLKVLKTKLEKNPGDGTGWVLLAKSYVGIKLYADALVAYENAVKLIPNDPQLLADYADALAVVNGYNLKGRPQELLNQALKINPHHLKSLTLAGTAAFDRKDYKQAIVLWERLEKDLPADSKMLPEVKAALKEVYALTGEKISATDAKDVSVFTGISGSVRIAPSLASKLDPATTVFIFARAAQGSPMPLAIVRTSVKDLPYNYHLDDSSAITPDHKLSQASEVVLVARVSKTGEAKARTGDLQGISASFKPSAANVDLEINQVVP